MRPEDIVPVILAGGRGTRLRPLTSPSRPKPFLKAFSRFSLLQETAKRLTGFASPVVVCNQAFGHKVLEELRAIQTYPDTIICEPSGRGTALPLALAAMKLENSGKIMMAVPSDHYIESDEIFRACAIRASNAAAQTEGAVFIGRPAHNASQRYGYIECNESGDGFFSVRRFIEKPPRAEALRMLSAAHCFWNTGVFLIKPNLFLDLLRRHAPPIYTAARRCLDYNHENPPFFYPDFDTWLSADEQSVDRALLQRISDAKLVRLGTEWHDIGCWPALLGIKLRVWLSRRNS